MRPCVRIPTIIRWTAYVGKLRSRRANASPHVPAHELLRWHLTHLSIRVEALELVEQATQLVVLRKVAEPTR